MKTQQEAQIEPHVGPVHCQLGTRDHDRSGYWISCEWVVFIPLREGADGEETYGPGNEGTSGFWFFSCV
jgi:hypothetical protein